MDNWRDDLAIACCDANCDDLSAQVQDAELCWVGAPWSGREGSDRMASMQQQRQYQGLLGGSPAQVASPLQRNNGTLQGGSGGSGGVTYQHPHNGGGHAQHHQQQNTFHTAPIEGNGMHFGEASIIPIRSFDYSHFKDGGNDMVPDPEPASESGSAAAVLPTNAAKTSPNIHNKIEREDAPESSPMSPARGTVHRDTTSPPAAPHFISGVPTFLPSFAQIKVSQVSAHPLGSHVLLISDAGLLYSYGLNDYGQLGIGLKTHVSGFHRGHIMTPTIVTPLVEHGGKAIACAAGVNHSLVVVKTEERRLVRSRSLEPAPAVLGNNSQHQYQQYQRQREDDCYSSAGPYASNETVVHHQLYGFGRNDFMKIGLMSPKRTKTGGGGPSDDEREGVVLPRRVALRCRVQSEGSYYASSPQGIFAIAASAEHSAALVRRVSGDVELYTWGNAMKGALGLPQSLEVLDGGSGLATPTDRVGTSSSLAVSVVPVPSFVASLSRTYQPEARSASMLLWDEEEHPVNLSLGRHCSFVTTSLGRCFSFGMSEEGMLGLGEGISEAPQPSEICLPRESRGEVIRSISAGALHVVASTKSGRVYAWGCRSHTGLGGRAKACSGGYSFGDGNTRTMINTMASDEQVEVDDGTSIAWSPEPVAIGPDPDAENATETSLSSFSADQPPSPTRIIQACAGYDSTVYVADSGHVLSCGKSSGRLGLGELPKSEHTVGDPRPLLGGLRLWQRRQLKKKPILTRGATVS